MKNCRTLTCINQAPDENFYCETCGGKERAEREGLLAKLNPSGKPKPFSRDGRGGGVGTGLSSLRQETEEERETRLAQERKDRDAREKKKQEKAEAERDRRKETAGPNGEVRGGPGTSKKARQQARKCHPGSDYYRSNNKGMAIRHKRSPQK